MWQVGPVAFHLYGFLIGLGILGGAFTALKLTKTAETLFWGVLVWVVAGGLVGARLYHVLDFWQYYWLHPGKIVMIWEGGMGIYGAILGGIGGLMVCVKSKKVFLELLDTGAVGLPVGQAIARWGNYFNQELYGKPTNLGWGVMIKPENRLMQVMDFERFHPLWLYESFWCLVGFLIIWCLIKKKALKKGTGGILITYLGWYGLGRFLLEFLRIESWQLLGVNVAQMISLGLVCLAIGWWIKEQR